MSLSNLTARPNRAPQRRAVGIALTAATILTVVALAFHPVAGGHEAGEVFLDILQKSTQSAFIHGVIIALFLGFALGFSEFAMRLGIQHPLVRAGLIVYLFGCISIVFAALLDGFVIADIARRFVAVAPDQAKVGFGLLVLASLLVQALTKLGLVLLSAGILAWSVALLRQPSRRWGTAVAGLSAGLVPVALILGVGMVMDPHLLILIFLLHAAWNIAAARLLFSNDA